MSMKHLSTTTGTVLLNYNSQQMKSTIEMGTTQTDTNLSTTFINFLEYTFEWY